jgi:hypothetical protein
MADQPITERPAEPGELCTCGRPAVVVYLGNERARPAPV